MKNIKLNFSSKTNAAKVFVHFNNKLNLESLIANQYSVEFSFEAVTT